MIDTVQLRHLSPMPKAAELLALGWNSICGHGDGDRFYLNRPNLPRLTWSRRENADWLSAEVSLPKFYFGNNVQSLRQAQLFSALSDLQSYVELSAQTKFDAPSALVGRVDYCHNFRLKNEEDVKKYIRTFQRVRLSKYDTQAINDSTVTLHAKSRQTCIYSKYDELSDVKETSRELLEKSAGILRVEPRFIKTASVSALSKRLETDRTAADLLRHSVWKKVMESELERIGADKPVLSSASRQRKLVERFGFNKAARLSGILSMREEQGETYVKSQMPKSTYQRIKKELQDLGLWLDAGEEELPALSLN